jgi:hypothetical protein
VSSGSDATRAELPDHGGSRIASGSHDQRLHATRRLRSLQHAAR